MMPFDDKKKEPLYVKPAPDIDDRRSSLPMRVIDHGRQMTFCLDVVGEGTLEMVVESVPFTGKLIYRGMRICPTTK